MAPHKLHISDLPASLPAWLAAIPADQGSLGWFVAAASVLESAAAKPGNVHPAAGFADLRHDDFLTAAYAIAEPFQTLGASIAEQPAHGESGPMASFTLGSVILTAVEAATAATRSNANLGIVLATAPLAAAVQPSRDGVREVLASLDKGDAALIWRAIRLAKPGGLGRVADHDLADPPPPCILEAMRLARDRDAIAELWADDFRPLFETHPERPGMVTLLEQAVLSGLPLGAAIQDAFLRHLAHHPDTLVARRHGHDIAVDLSQQAAALLTLPNSQRADAVDAFDRRLRAGRWSDGQQRPLNPGTTADLVAAGLFVLLRRGWTLELSSPNPLPHCLPTAPLT